MIEAVFMMGGLGIIVGVGLAAAAKIFYVYVDPKVVAVDEALPGANCGGCGYPGCSANAEAIVAGKSAANSCVAGSPELADEIAAIMGVSLEAKEADIARPGCYYGLQDADQKYIYNGLNDCRAVALLGGGTKVCTIGCLGLGTCQRACPFDAITMGPEGLPVVDEQKCTGCGTCERVCPKHIINLSSVTRRILREYTIEECTTPCQRRCPAGINIREYIRQIELGDYHRSVQVIKERNPFPTVIGRICPRPCEFDCRRKYIDEPVAINFLKRFVADYEREHGQRILPFKAPASNRRIAVIGGGVHGLSTAFFAARLGHQPTVYEATAKLGGLLRSAIASYRLPDEILDWDIEGILEMGVEVETQKMLGRNFSIDGLLSQGYEAVFLASGGWDSRLTRTSGSHVEKTVPDMFLLLDLIKNPDKISCRSDVVIYGGGKLALEAAKICRERGANNITLMCRENWQDLAFSDDDVKNLGVDNMQVVFEATIDRLFGEDNHLTSLDYVALDTLEKKKIPVGTLIIASGRFPELIFITSKPADADTEQSEHAPLRWESIECYKRPEQLSEIGLLAQGDVFSDYSAAIKAIGAGRRAAASIHQFMYGIGPELPEKVITATSILQDVDQVEMIQASGRQIMPLCSSQELEACKELEKGFTESMARAEAARCLQCGLICYQRPGLNKESATAAASVQEIGV